MSITEFSPELPRSADSDSYAADERRKSEQRSGNFLDYFIRATDSFLSRNHDRADLIDQRASVFADKPIDEKVDFTDRSAEDDTDVRESNQASDDNVAVDDDHTEATTDEAASNELPRQTEPSLTPTETLNSDDTAASETQVLSNADVSSTDVKVDTDTSTTENAVAEIPETLILTQGEQKRSDAVANALVHANRNAALFAGKFGDIDIPMINELRAALTKPQQQSGLENLNSKPSLSDQGTTKPALAGQFTQLREAFNAPRSGMDRQAQDVLPPLRQLAISNQLAPQERPGELNSLIQFFQARSQQTPSANMGGTSVNQIATGGDASAKPLAAMQTMMENHSQSGHQGQDNGQSGLGQSVQAAAKNGAAPQNAPASGGVGQFASNLALTGAGTTNATPLGAMQVQSNNPVMNGRAPQQPATTTSAPTVQIAFQIAKAMDQGLNRMNIRLDPAELGRVHVQLDVTTDGRVATTVTVERPETLELLQRDSRSLEKALQDAGLDTEDGDLTFNLKQDDGSAWAENNSSDGGSTKDQGDDMIFAADEADEEVTHLISDRALDVRI